MMWKQLEGTRAARVTEPRRFLFLFSDTGGGHRASTQAVKDEMERLYGPAASVKMIDVFKELERWPFHRFPAWYPICVGLNGIPWGVGFHLSDGVRVMKTMSRLVWPYARHPVCDLLRRYPADAIISFHPIPNYTLFLGLRQMGWNVPLGVVTVDMVTAHASWFVPGADLYLVPTHAAKARALRWGVAESRIKVTGMPTRRPFVTTMDLPKRSARERLSLPPDRPIVLIVGGGEGMGPLGQVVRLLARRLHRLKGAAAHIVVITGRNKALHQELVRSNLPGSVQIEGFVSDMEAWMRAADILVTKAGPNSLAEAFLAGLPLVLYTALPGQEEGNIDYVVGNGAGLWAPLPRLALRAVLGLLENPRDRLVMADRSRALARPFAAGLIAREIWQLADPVRRLSDGITGEGVVQRPMSMK